MKYQVPPIETASIGLDDDLLEEGLIDSLEIVLLLRFIPEEFSVNIDADEIQPENSDADDRVAAGSAR